MAQNITLLHYISGDTARAYPLLLDLRAFGRQHPYMTDVRLLHHHPPKVRYAVYETIKLPFFLTVRPQYQADVMEIIPDQHIRYQSEAPGGLTLQIDFYFEHTTDRRLLIREEVEVKGNRLLNALFVQILSKAHRRTFARIQQYCLT